VPQPKPDDHLHPVKCYLGEPAAVQEYITHPYASPLFGDLTGLPPMLIQCGDAEVLRDEGTLFAHKASLAGVDVHHEVYADCPHVFQAFIFLDASRQALQNARTFVKSVVLAHREPASMDPTSIDRELLSDAHAVKEDAELDPASLPSVEEGGPTPHPPHPHGVPPSGGVAPDRPTETEETDGDSGVDSRVAKGRISEEEEEAKEEKEEVKSLVDPYRPLSSPVRASKRTRSRAKSVLETCADVASSSCRDHHRRSASQTQLPADVSGKEAEGADGDGGGVVRRKGHSGT
jgi:hypothetical protein